MVTELIKQLRASFSTISDKRNSAEYSICDILTSGFAVFHLKDPSLLSFMNLFPLRESNMKSVYGIEKVPSDTLLRTVLDDVSPSSLTKCFKVLLDTLRQEGILAQYEVLPSLGGSYVAISCDGTGYFRSDKIECPSCLQRTFKNGQVQHYHQFLGACLVHPDHKCVFPVSGEGIVKGDGQTKNDCEHKALLRFCPTIKAFFPDKHPILLLDALHVDGNTIRRILGCQMSFISVIKDTYVTVQVAALERTEGLQKMSWYKDKSILCTAQWATGLILNGANQDLRVQYIRYQETDTRTRKTLYYNEWITDLPITALSIQEFVQLAPCRWKIENETFNTLKNQDYNFEHNYGHGKKFLSIIFVLLMLLAFFVDQVTLFVDKAFQKALTVVKTFRDLRQATRVLFDLIPCDSFDTIYRIIARDIHLSMREI